MNLKIIYNKLKDKLWAIVSSIGLLFKVFNLVLERFFNYTIHYLSGRKEVLLSKYRRVYRAKWDGIEARTKRRERKQKSINSFKGMGNFVYWLIFQTSLKKKKIIGAITMQLVSGILLFLSIGWWVWFLYNSNQYFYLTGFLLLIFVTGSLLNQVSRGKFYNLSDLKSHKSNKEKMFHQQK